MLSHPKKELTIVKSIKGFFFPSTIVPSDTISVNTMKYKYAGCSRPAPIDRQMKVICFLWLSLL